MDYEFKEKKWILKQIIELCKQTTFLQKPLQWKIKEERIPGKIPIRTYTTNLPSDFVIYFIPDLGPYEYFYNTEKYLSNHKLIIKTNTGFTIITYTLTEAECSIIYDNISTYIESKTKALPAILETMVEEISKSDEYFL